MKKVFLFVLGAMVVGIVVMLLVMSNGLSEGVNVLISGVDLTNTPDGDYTGSYEYGRWTNTLTVHVKDHAIISIDIEKDVTFAQPGCSDEIFRRVMEARSTKVDAVAGATVTSKAYLKAIEDALQQ